MGIISSTDQKLEHKSQNNNQVPSGTPGKAGVSSSTWRRYDDFMKGGGCKEVFTDFLDCVYEAEKKKELTGPCYTMLQKCMEAHSDYYQPILASDKKTVEKDLYEGLMKAILPSTVSLNELSEEEVERSFTTFMEGGSCKESFTAWYANCNFTEEAGGKNEEDLVTKCAGLFGTLLKCVSDHSDYYHPILAAVKATEEHALNDLEALFSKPS